MTNDTKWTPGPWEYRPREHDDWGEVRGAADANGVRWLVARATAGGPTDDASRARHRESRTDPYEVNGRLIAAAPDLYEALTDMLAGWEYIRQHHGDLYGVGWDRCEALANAALIKARGEPLTAAKAAPPVLEKARP